MDKKRLVQLVVISSLLMVVLAVFIGMTVSSAFAEDATGPAKKEAKGPNAATPFVAIAIAVSVASGAIGAGYAVGKVGSAAIGAASERPEIMGRALVFVVIAEGIAVWGLVGAILLIGSL